MSTEIQKKTLPKLRFPEFGEAEEWEQKKLSDLLDYERPDNYIVSDTNYHKTGTPVLTANKSFILGYTDEKNGIYINLPAIIFDDFTVDKKYVDFPFKIKSSAIKILKSKGANNLRFTFELMSQLKYDAKEHKRYYISVYQNILVPVPKPTEQQKIADCLSSLDDLIIAEKQKLEVLKSHKKGLMQQLFPAEGETMPMLRFAQFSKSGDWEIKMLGNIAENLDFKRIPITENKREKGTVPYYGASGIIDFVKDFIYDEQLLCISEDGANLIDRNYPIAFSIEGKTWVNNHAHVLKFENYFTQTIVENYLNEIRLEDYLTGMAQPKLNRSKLDIIPIPLPRPLEQQQIAECISLLNNLITAEEEKIEALKVHKKGLMQSLFPSINE
jgi:type I restriction enzyme, S subunit